MGEKKKYRGRGSVEEEEKRKCRGKRKCGGKEKV